MLVRVRWILSASVCPRTLCTGEMIPFLRTTTVASITSTRRITGVFAQSSNPTKNWLAGVAPRRRWASGLSCARDPRVFRTSSALLLRPPHHVRRCRLRSTNWRRLRARQKRGLSAVDLYRGTHAAVEVTIKFSACAAIHTRIPNILLWYNIL